MRKLTLALLLCPPLFLPWLQAQDRESEARPFLKTTKPFTADRHVARGLNCANCISCFSCHGEGDKKTAVGSDKCLACHRSFKEVAEKTQGLRPNPHQNHLVESGNVECTSCHNGHKANEISCWSCHATMNFEGKLADP